MCALRTKLIVLQRFVKKYERKKKGRNKNSLLLGHIVMITAINKKIKQVCASFMNLIMPPGMSRVRQTDDANGRDDVHWVHVHASDGKP